jgi:hypothetical protein
MRVQQKTLDQITVKGALRALVLGALFGGVWLLCGPWPGSVLLLCAVLQSMVSGIVLGIGSSGRLQDLTLDLESLESCLEHGYRTVRGARDVCRLGTAIRPMFVAS